MGEILTTRREMMIVPMLAGTLDVAAALDAGALEVRGDRRVLEAFAGLFGGDFTGMGVLYASVRKEP